jgi:hypothetical protein
MDGWKDGQTDRCTWVWGPRAPTHLGLKSPTLCAPITTQGSPAALLKLQMAPRLMLIMSSGSRRRSLDANAKVRLRPHTSGVPIHFFGRGGSTNSVEGRENRDLGR